MAKILFLGKSSNAGIYFVSCCIGVYYPVADPIAGGRILLRYEKGKEDRSRVASFCILFLHGATLKADAATHRFAQDIGFYPPSISGLGGWYTKTARWM